MKIRQEFRFLLRCPHCKNTMQYHTDSKILGDKRKSCVYCPKSFKARDTIVKEL